MKKMSVHDILLECGEWIESSYFTSKVAEKQQISPRQAYRNIKHAYELKEIKKYIFEDRTVMYGLPKFGSPPKDKPLSEASRVELIKESMRQRTEFKKAELQYYASLNRTE